MSKQLPVVPSNSQSDIAVTNPATPPPIPPHVRVASVLGASLVVPAAAPVADVVPTADTTADTTATPAVETPAIETPATAMPVVETPATATPAIETPVADMPPKVFAPWVPRLNPFAPRAETKPPFVGSHNAPSRIILPSTDVVLVEGGQMKTRHTFGGALSAFDHLIHDFDGANDVTPPQLAPIATPSAGEQMPVVVTTLDDEWEPSVGDVHAAPQIPTTREIPQISSRPTEGGVVDSYIAPIVEHRAAKPFFGTLPQGPYVAVLGGWAMKDAALIREAFVARGCDAYVADPNNWNEDRMGADKQAYVDALVEHEANAMMEASVCILDLRGMYDPENDYLLGALGSSQQRTYVVLGEDRRNYTIRAKVKYFMEQGVDIAISANIFDAVLNAASDLDALPYLAQVRPGEFTYTDPMSNTAQSWTAEDANPDRPRKFSIGVGVLVRNNEGQYLAFRQKNGAGPRLPFGFLHNDERPAEAAARILASEVGVVVSDDDLVEVKIAWRGRRSGYVACFGIKATAVIRKTAPDADHVDEVVWAEPEVLGAHEAYGAFNRTAMESYDTCGTTLATVMDIRGTSDLMNVSTTVQMAANDAAEKAATPVAQA